jgi:hypothetical protein
MGTKTELRRLLLSPPLTGTDEEIATAHETNRQSAVKEILVHIFFMAKYGLIPGPLTVSAAESQYVVAQGGNQAAHCAPGQIMHGTALVQDLLLSTSNPDLDLDLTVENLFGKTDTMHPRFNKADRDAEAGGLLTALQTACNYVADRGRTAKFGRAWQIVPHIDNGYKLYKGQGTQAFTNAIASENALMAAGKPLTMTTRPEVIAILNTYRRTLQTSFDTIETVQGLDPENVWRFYTQR